MPDIELIYDPDCPNVASARRALLEACRRVGLSPDWREWDRSAPAIPDHVRSSGSPTILVDGHDVAGLHQSESCGASCRVYTDAEGGLRGAPPVDLIVAALRDAADAQ